jgi:hypothetical protein
MTQEDMQLGLRWTHFSILHYDELVSWFSFPIATAAFLPQETPERLAMIATLVPPVGI